MVQPIDSLLKVELRRMQEALNYHATQPINVFITSDAEKHADLVKEQSWRSSNMGGRIPLHKNRVVLKTSYGPQQIGSTFRKELAEILVTEMMFGGSLQDNIKNANLIQLPEWAIPGLVNYLANGWSAELDNDMRLYFANNQLHNLNTVKPSQLPLLGASFWYFVDQVQGKSAIPTLLYMARLSRKFNSALFYAFQWSLSDLYTNWSEFYTKAYTRDLSKPNPVEGSSLQEEGLLEWYVESKQQYYTLIRQIGRVQVLEHRSGKKTKIHTFKSSHQPLPLFSGALFVNKDPYVVYYRGNSAQLMNVSSKKVEEIGLNGITKISSNGDSLILLQANLMQSRVFLWRAGKLEVLWDTTCFIQDLAISKTGNIVLHYEKEEASVFQVRDKTCQSIICTKQLEYKARQPIWANDSNILFNHLKNGIWNGAIWNIENQQVSFVTDYGLNIVHHSYSPRAFAELIDNGRKLSMPVTENLLIQDFYTYDTLTPAYFSRKSIEFADHKVTNQPVIPDSLEEYTFQSPVNPESDFTTSNYDSLFKANEAKLGYLEQSVPAKERFSLSGLVIQANNQIESNQLVGFPEAVSTITPDNINLRSGFYLTNQFNNKFLFLGYEGIIQPGAHQLDIGYRKDAKLSYGLDYMHRRRLQMQNSNRVRYTTDCASVFIGKTVLNHVETIARLSIINFQKNPLATSIDNLLTEPEHRQLYNIHLKATSTIERSEFRLSNVFQLNPYIVNGLSANVVLNSKVRYSPFNWLQLRGKVEAAKSIGSNPTFYALGGAAYDVTNRHLGNAYTDFYTAASYQLVTGVRGFATNSRNGNTYGVLNVQADIKPLHTLIKRPIVAELFNHLTLATFLDLGTAYFGSNSYHPANIFGTRTIASSTGSVVAEVRSYQNPVMLGTGFGVATRIYGYQLRLDYAWGFEEFIQTQTNWHAGIGYAF